MLNLNNILIFSENPKDLAEFYKKILQKDPEWAEGDFQGFRVGSGMMAIGGHENIHGKNLSPERLIFNFETNDVGGEFERIKNLGAKVIAKPYHPMEDSKMLIATFADPDGNYFQLVSPMKE